MAVISAISVLETTESLLERVGFQKLVFEDFYDDFLGLINAVIQPRQDGQLLTINSLLEAFNVPEGRALLLNYMNLLTIIYQSP